MMKASGAGKIKALQVAERFTYTQTERLSARQIQGHN
jgi:hypothetical protein